MRRFSWWQHLLIAVLVTVVLLAVFATYAPRLPSTEDISPQIYFVASLMLLAGCIRMGKQPLRWLYWLLLGLCVFIFLDEIAYGVELMGFEPIYIEQYNFYIRDVHSSVGFAREVLAEWLPQAGWNPAVLSSFLRVDFVLLLGVLVLWLAARQGLQGASEARWQQRILRLLAGLAGLTSLLLIGFLLQLPADPKNAVLFGFSAARLGLLAMAVLYPGLLLWLRFAQPQRWQRGLAAAERIIQRHAKALGAVFALVLLAGLVFQLQSSFMFLPDELVRLTRVAAAVTWLMAQALWLWLALLLWRGWLRTPVVKLIRDGWQLVKDHPTLIYVGVSVLIIFIAQLIDQNYLPLDEMLYTPNYHIQYWGGWLEETLEMIGAFLFALAAVVMPPRAATRPPRSRSR